MLHVYCNQCFESKAETKRNYFVTACFHVFCEGCLQNSKKYCLICKKQCKVLPINDALPSEVKDYFDPNSIERMVHKIEKISHFMETQNQAYVAKNSHYHGTYYKYKKSYMEMKEYGMKIESAIQREKAIMNKLKQAYQSKVITPNLFQLRSPPLIDFKDFTRSSGYHSDQSKSENLEMGSSSKSGKSLKLDRLLLTSNLPGRSLQQQQDFFDLQRPSQKQDSQNSRFH